MTPPEGWPAGVDYDEAKRLGQTALIDDQLPEPAWPRGTTKRVLDAIAPLIAKAVAEAERPCEHCARYNEDGAAPMAWCACPDCWERLAGKWKDAEAYAERLAVVLRRSGLGFHQSDRVPSTTRGTLTPSSTTLEARDALAAHEARKAGRKNHK